MIAPNKAAMPLVLTMPIMIGTNAKLVPCITGSRAPTGPKPMVWNKVATPANSIAICTKNTIIEGVTLLANIASTCWTPSAARGPSGKS